MTPDEMASFLDRPVTGTFTTLESDGWPHSSAMWFVPEADRILMWTYASSQKALNASRDPRSAFLVEDGEIYGELRGVLVRGELEVVTDVEAITSVGRRLYERYTQVQTGVPYEAGPNIEVERQAAKRVALYLPMSRVASWDFRKL